MNMLRRSTNFFDQKRGSKIQATDAGSNSIVNKSSKINTKLANGNNAPAKSPRFGCSGGASAKNLNVTAASSSSAAAATGSMTPLRSSKQVKNLSSLSTARANNNKGKAESVVSS